MTPHEALDAALLRCWTIHAGGKYDKEAFKTLQRFVDDLPAAIERKIAEAVAAEREACADAARELLTKGRSPLGKAVHDAIMARSNR